ncbi:MAG: Hsp70 family protein [Bdellovibrionaceae bacterium]|nr:Hsp70 family protein [Pseudobdellovibrionaceae bacterium]
MRKDYLGQGKKEAVITVPAYFNDARQATMMPAASRVWGASLTNPRQPLWRTALIRKRRKNRRL